MLFKSYYSNVSCESYSEELTLCSCAMIVCITEFLQINVHAILSQKKNEETVQKAFKQLS